MVMELPGIDEIVYVDSFWTA